MLVGTRAAVAAGQPLGGESRRYVVLDDEGAAQIACSTCSELGHTRIAHVAGPRGPTPPGAGARAI
jgi:DNA-binding LacI/PurR family transcriptional regulator